MRFSAALGLFAASLALAAPAPVPGDDGKQDPGEIAACETQTAAEQVKCIDDCNMDASCIVACTAKAVAGYTGCAGVGPDPAPKAPK
ncbi:hypothetical protein CCHL11_08991 [Colletotrichum chlorophyti]|uniref:Uncharacterized protein n=1 Tax=Colletotrichum chlorophyti TaxID=708187 RepID=A0A1Q8RWX4_9PEZI|nr:hypothetical protein CCHL11_08991 [Colletotrichum chlorophyti]